MKIRINVKSEKLERSWQFLTNRVKARPCQCETDNLLIMFCNLHRQARRLLREDVIPHLAPPCQMFVIKEVSRKQVAIRRSP